MKLQYALLAARVAIGSLFLWSGIHKAASPEDFAAVVEAYRMVPPHLVMTFATTLPWLEALLGAALLSGYLTRAAAAGVGAMLLAFIGAISSTLARGIPLANCGCFGETMHLTRGQALTLDSTMLVLCFLLWRSRRHPSALDNWVEQATL